MLGKRAFPILAAVVLLVVAAFNFQTGTALAAVSPHQIGASDTSVRQPAPEIPLAGDQTGNIQQYPESVLQRHPELLQSVSGDVSGWNEQHYDANKQKYDRINR